MQNIISTLTVALGASWCAGINLYATLATLGLMQRFVPDFHLPGDLAILSSWWIIIAASIMYVIEFAADKFPHVDNMWDIVHTFIRIPAGAVLAAMAFGKVPPQMQIAAGMMGGSLALSSHGAKAALRGTVNATGLHVAGAGILISLVEDLVVILNLYLTRLMPVLSLFIIVGLIGATIIFLILMWHTVKRLLKGWGKTGWVETPPHLMQQASSVNAPTSQNETAPVRTITRTVIVRAPNDASHLN